MSGYTSRAGSWVGGFSSPRPVVAGYRSFFGFWLGGFAFSSGVVVPVARQITRQHSIAGKMDIGI